MDKLNEDCLAGTRYSVPLGTYDGTDKQVGIRVSENSMLVIYDRDTGQMLAEHELCLGRGQLIQKTNHRRDRSKDIPAYLETVASLFPAPEQAKPFLEHIYRLKPGYIRD